jgi:hypothetical protein
MPALRIGAGRPIRDRRLCYWLPLRDVILFLGIYLSLRNRAKDDLRNAHTNGVPTIMLLASRRVPGLWNRAPSRLCAFFELRRITPVQFSLNIDKLFK